LRGGGRLRGRATVGLSRVKRPRQGKIGKIGILD